MKKRLLASFIFLAISSAILANSSFDKNENLIVQDTLPFSTLENETSTTEADDPNNKGDELYYDLGYLTSTDYFLKKEAEGNISNKEIEKLANSYRLNGMSEEAEYWYALIANDNSKPENMMHYAEMLQSNGKCEDASRWFKMYQESTGDESRTFIEDCNAIQDIPVVQGVVVTNVEQLNTRALDFSPILYKDGLVFSSTREQKRSMKNTDKWTKGKFSDLFFVKIEGDEFSKVKPLEGANKKFHDGTATFNHSGNYMIFTRTDKKSKSKKGIRELKLYEASLDGNKWTKIKSLNINDNEFATCHPTLSLDGKRLYFSSNRPGGYGGMDIYMSRKVGGKWTSPQNLGPVVNSSGNEVFPYLHNDEKLYFSSNGHKGVGGLDIFTAEKTMVNDETSWNTRNNLGQPFNSPKDDIGFTMALDQQSGYFSSNRPGGKGKDDIYHWTTEQPTLVKQVENVSTTGNVVGTQVMSSGTVGAVGTVGTIGNYGPAPKALPKKTLCVYNIQTNERIEGVSVGTLPLDFQENNQEMALTLKPSRLNQNEYVFGIEKQNKTLFSSETIATDEFGKFQYPMDVGKDYYFILTKKGFGTVQHQTDLETVSKRKDYCIAMAPRACKTMSGTVNNKDFDRPVPFANVEMFNRCTGEVLLTRTDEKGGFEFCVDCDCEYELVVSKERFNQGNLVISTLGEDCQMSNLENVTVELGISDEANQNSSTTIGHNNKVQHHPFDNQYSQSSSYTSNGSSAPPTEEFLLEYFTGDGSNVITTGQKLILKNIYYNFNQAELRSDAEVELDYIANLMKMQPTMEIALYSHTDTRGKEDYNKELSQRRANNAKEYLISKGINAQRIQEAKGMGETKPISPCDNCSDEEHQINRRTEVLVLKI